MHDRSKLKIVASLLGIVGACATDDYVSSPYYYDSYAYPVVDYGYGTDTMLWYDGYYDPYIGYAALTASPVLDGGNGKSLPRPIRGLLSTWRAALRADCAPSVAAPDYDEDGIPASYEATFNCVNLTVDNRTSSVTGTISIADTDDNTRLSGFTMTFTNFNVTTTASGSSRARTLNGTATVTPADRGVYQTTTNLSIDFDLADTGRTRVQGTYNGMGQGTYTADNASGDDLFASGTVTLSGTGTLSRMFNGSTQSRGVTRQTLPSLHWNRDCRTQNPDSSGFDNGALVFQDDQKAKVQLQFNGCGAPTVTTGG